MDWLARQGARLRAMDFEKALDLAKLRLDLEGKREDRNTTRLRFLIGLEASLFVVASGMLVRIVQELPRLEDGSIAQPQLVWPVVVWIAGIAAIGRSMTHTLGPTVGFSGAIGARPERALEVKIEHDSQGFTGIDPVGPPDSTFDEWLRVDRAGGIHDLRNTFVEKGIQSSLQWLMLGIVMLIVAAISYVVVAFA